jgi:pullulanase
LAGGLVLTSQGVPLLHAGVDFCRTKGGNGNSYKSPDSVNQLDWDRKNTYIDVFNYYQKLIQFRKNHPAFRMSSAEQIRRDLNFCTQYQIGVVSYCIDAKTAGDSWNKIIMIFNGNDEVVSIPLPAGNYKIVANGSDINEEGLGDTVTDEILAEAISMTILVEAK